MKTLSIARILYQHFPEHGLLPSCAFKRTGEGEKYILEKQEKKLILCKSYNAKIFRRYLISRQYKLLKSLNKNIAPYPIFYIPGWIGVDYLTGKIKKTLPPLNKLVSLLYDLHQQPNFGWRVCILPFIQHYWEKSNPKRKTRLWLRTLKFFVRYGEPKFFKLSPLHMDIHPANIVYTRHGIKFIDWEYAGDGDVALELSLIPTEKESQRKKMVIYYSKKASVSPNDLWSRTRMWRPWVLVLIASWYEYQAYKRESLYLLELADNYWKKITFMGSDFFHLFNKIK